MTTFLPVGRLRRSTRRVGSFATLSVMGLMLVFAAGPAAAVTRTPYNTNLVKNPSFEAGNATGGYKAVYVPYWTTSGKMTVVKYGAPNGFPTLAEGARISGGKKFFTHGTPVSGSDSCLEPATQRIQIRGRAAATDAGLLSINLQGYVGTYDSQPDTAIVVVNSYDSAGRLISNTLRISATHTNGVMQGYGHGDQLPVGTRSIKIFLYARDTQGYCDAYFDRIRVWIRPIDYTP